MTDTQGDHQGSRTTTDGDAGSSFQPGSDQTRYGQPPQYEQAPFGQPPQYGQPSYGQQAPYGQQPPYGQPPQYEQRDYGQQRPQQQTGQPSGTGPWPQPGMNAPMAGGPGDPYGYMAPRMEPPLNQPYYHCPLPQAIARFFRKYVDFSGRASRSEYWWPTLGYAIVYALADFINDRTGHFGWFESLFAIAVFLPFIAVTVRRLHDSNRSGWWIALPMGLSAAGILSGIVLLAQFLVRAGSASGLRMHSMSALADAGTAIVVWAFFALICWLASIVIHIIFMVAPSDSRGVRFDEYSMSQPSMPQPPLGPPMPMNGQYGNAYPQHPGAYQPWTPQAPQAPQSPQTPQTPQPARPSEPTPSAQDGRRPQDPDARA